MLALSIGKYVRKENIQIERPPARLGHNNWIVHLSMTEIEANEMQEIHKNKPTALNLMCSKIWFTIIKSEKRKPPSNLIPGHRLFDDINKTQTNAEDYESEVEEEREDQNMGKENMITDNGDAAA